MDLSHYTLWQLIELNEQIQLQCFIKIWWIIPVVVIAVAFIIIKGSR